MRHRKLAFVGKAEAIIVSKPLERLAEFGSLRSRHSDDAAAATPRGCPLDDLLRYQRICGEGPPTSSKIAWSSQSPNASRIRVRLGSMPMGGPDGNEAATVLAKMA